MCTFTVRLSPRLYESDSSVKAKQPQFCGVKCRGEDEWTMGAAGGTATALLDHNSLQDTVARQAVCQARGPTKLSAPSFSQSLVFVFAVLFLIV